MLTASPSSATATLRCPGTRRPPAPHGEPLPPTLAQLLPQLPARPRSAPPTGPVGLPGNRGSSATPGGPPAARARGPWRAPPPRLRAQPPASPHPAASAGGPRAPLPLACPGPLAGRVVGPAPRERWEGLSTSSRTRDALLQFQDDFYLAFSLSTNLFGNLNNLKEPAWPIKNQFGLFCSFLVLVFF